MSAQDIDSTLHQLEAGTVLKENYIIEDVLGKGGFGITYLATDKDSRKKYAIKEYFDRGKRRFLKEANALKDLQDLECVVPIIDVFEENDTAYLVMDYIEGITLKDYLTQNGTLTFKELFRLVRPLMTELSYIHEKGLIHRDISPDNLMIGTDNRLHLIDFGAANAINTNETKTMTVILKSGYAPPEQYLSDGRIGPWTDVYGLCATMYKALTGLTPPESIRRLQDDNLKPLSENAAYGIADWQAAAILQGMELKIADRFRSMEQLQYALISCPSIEEDETRHGDTLTEQEAEDIYALGMSQREKQLLEELIDNKRRQEKMISRLSALLFAVVIIGGLGIFFIVVLPRIRLWKNRNTPGTAPIATPVEESLLSNKKPTDALYKITKPDNNTPGLTIYSTYDIPSYEDSNTYILGYLGANDTTLYITELVRNDSGNLFYKVKLKSGEDAYVNCNGTGDWEIEYIKDLGIQKPAKANYHVKLKENLNSTVYLYEESGSQDMKPCGVVYEGEEFYINKQNVNNTIYGGAYYPVTTRYGISGFVFLKPLEQWEREILK